MKFCPHCNRFENCYSRSSISHDEKIREKVVSYFCEKCHKQIDLKRTILNYIPLPKNEARKDLVSEKIISSENIPIGAIDKSTRGRFKALWSNLIKKEQKIEQSGSL